MKTYKFYSKIFLLLFAIILCSKAFTQQSKFISGVVRDKQSDEVLPFISVYFVNNHKGITTDTAGRFTLNLERVGADDSVKISGVGYKELTIPLSIFRDSNELTIKMVVLPPKAEATVKTKYNRALWFWKKIIKNKYKHERENYTNYSYEIHNRLELDINNVDKSKLQKSSLLKSLNFILDYVDTVSESKAFLPVYLTETLSDYFYTSNPRKTREVIKATKANGIENESILKQLGGTYQNIDIYANFIPVFTKQFISPFNDGGDKYYNFKLLDTQFVNKRRVVHFRFTPKQAGTDVFEGDCYVHDSSLSIQKITLRPSVDANINFISGLSIIQEYSLINDSIWFLARDKFVADISPIGEKNISLKGRKTTTYRNIILNDSFNIKEVAKNNKALEIILLPNTNHFSDSFWNSNRHEDLSATEKQVYKLIDTLQKNKTFITYRNTFKFVTTGVRDIGKIRIGPWFNWISGNRWEGLRLRFDAATNRKFDDHWNLNGYVAYGTKDGTLKGKFETRYLFNREPWSYVSATYQNDLDNAQMYTDQLGTDNVFATLFRRKGIPFKFQRAEEFSVKYYEENHSGLDFGLTAKSKQYKSLLNLPDSFDGNPVKTFEAIGLLRFAYLERTIEQNFNRFSLGSDLPIIELRYTKGLKGILNSSYEYDKLDFSLIDNIKVPPYGKIYYNLFAGKVYGTLPYPFLEILPGNEMHYYNRRAFNLMKRFEYIADQYAGFSIEHAFGNGLTRFVPFLRKLRLRQLWTAKGVVGSLSQENQDLNFKGNHPFNTLNGKMYVELGTAIDNIAKLFRIDFVWRVTPPNAENTINSTYEKFGVFGSFRIQF